MENIPAWQAISEAYPAAILWPLYGDAIVVNGQTVLS